MAQCNGCGADLNPVAVMLGPVCGECVRDRHAVAVGTMTAATAERRAEGRRRGWTRSR